MFRFTQEPSSGSNCA